MDEMEHNEDTPEVSLDLDAQHDDLESAMRDAVAAVEEVERGTAGDPPAAAAGATRPQPAEGGSDDQEVEKLRREIADLRDRSMRTLADFDNFRKRSERERQELKKYALVEPLRGFLEIMDNLDLALAAAGSADDLKRGIEMIHRQMTDLLRRFGVQEVAALGQPFDPSLHEAVSREEDPSVQAPTVTGEMRRGYRLHDRLLRPSMVKVSVPVESAKPAGSSSQVE
ncbi:MAG TPA: nucleotide exchange factor GrpE [Thermoanaerobaculia bacterium]|nr:nucleotide exchange factor GrpE [Thermoanaerobaculia bacterium]